MNGKKYFSLNLHSFEHLILSSLCFRRMFNNVAMV